MLVGIVVTPQQAAAQESPGADDADNKAEFNWRLDRSRKGIDIYTRSVEGSGFRAVKATVTVPYAMTALVALVQDTAACPEWAHLCKAARVLEAPSPFEQITYTHNDLPWPVSDRDAVTRVRWRLDEASGAVSMTATAVPGYLPEEKGRVRLLDAVTSWTFVPMADGQVQVISQAHIDPGGPMPAWLINRMLLDAPFKTLTNLQSILATGRYDDAEIPFLSD